MNLIEESQETRQLLESAMGGDEAAVDQLFNRHLPVVKESIRRRVAHCAQARFDASDVIQETHRTALQQLDEYLLRRPVRFRLWLLRNAQQRLIEFERKHLRAAKRAIDREVPLPDASSMGLLGALGMSVRSPDDELVLREHARIVRLCLARLAELDRQVLLLRVFDGLKNVEVASVLDISPDAAKKRFARALERLRDLLVDAGIQEVS